MIKSPVYDILEKRVPSCLLNDYQEDVFDETLGRFYAYTYVRLQPENYEFALSVLDIFPSGTCAFGCSDEQVWIYNEETRGYNFKSHDQGLKEGQYHAYAITFHGCLYNGWWYISKDLTYFGEQAPEAKAFDILRFEGKIKDVLHSKTYLPIESHFPVRDADKQPRPLGVEYQEFIGIPELVAYQMQEQKSEVNKFFNHYVDLDILSPFIERIKVARFEVFSELIPLNSRFAMIYPNSREYILFPMLARDIDNVYKLYYFFWHRADKKMYQWTYFTPEVVSSRHLDAEAIIENLSKISYWNKVDYLYSSCTLDDDKFWNEYVVVQADNGKYSYLTASIY